MRTRQPFALAQVVAGVALAVMLAAPVRASDEFALHEKKQCLHCHRQANGRGRDPLNPVGRYYQEFHKLPEPGNTLIPRAAAGVVPPGAWHPEREPAREPVGHSRTQRESERELKGRMARWTRSLGAKNCYFCHAEKLPGATVEQLRDSQRHYEVAVRHAELTSLINRSLGGDKVSCYTCHLGGRGPVTMPGSSP